MTLWGKYFLFSKFTTLSYKCDENVILPNYFTDGATGLFPVPHAALRRHAALKRIVRPVLLNDGWTCSATMFRQRPVSST